MISSRYLRRSASRYAPHFWCTETAKRPHVDAEMITYKALDSENTLGETQSYNFVMKTDRIEKGLKDLFIHQAWTPASLLLKNHYHLFPPQMPEFNRQQSYKAFEKLVAKRYEEAYKKCEKPNQIFHMTRRIKMETRRFENRIGVIDQDKFKHYPMWTTYRDVKGANTLRNYELKGVPIEILKHNIFPTGKIWLPTRQNFLALFDKYLSTTGILSRSDNAIDVGCGSGVLSFILSRRMKKSSKLIGIDINPNAVFTSNINASKLQVDNFKAFEFNILKFDYFKVFAGSENIPRQYNLIVCNPPWIVAKKMDSQIGIEDGVYDQKEQFLNSILKFTQLHLKEDGRLLLLYSTLSRQLQLTQNTIESLCEKYKLQVCEKLEEPYIEKLESYDPLAVFKQQSKIQLFEIKKI